MPLCSLLSPLSQSRVGDLGVECFCRLLGCTVVPPWLSHSDYPACVALRLCLQSCRPALSSLSGESRGRPGLVQSHSSRTLCCQDSLNNKGSCVTMCSPLFWISSKMVHDSRGTGRSHISIDVVSSQEYLVHIMSVYQSDPKLGWRPETGSWVPTNMKTFMPLFC